MPEHIKYYSDIHCILLSITQGRSRQFIAGSPAAQVAAAVKMCRKQLTTPTKSKQSGSLQRFG